MRITTRADRTGADAARAWRQQDAAQRSIDAHFEAAAPFWDQVYEGSDTASWLFKHRLAVTLAWIDSLNLSRPARILDAGCGAGLASVALAQRGYQVDAIDPAPAMIALTQRNIEKASVTGQVDVRPGDVHALDAETGVYDAVIALGLVPWLHSPERALQEMARVLKPNGHLIATSSNRRALSVILEPMHSPPLESLRHAVTQLLRRLGLRRVPPHGERARLYRRRDFDRLIEQAGLTRIEDHTYGFGPFSVFGRKLPDRLGGRLQNRLQALADRGLIGLRSAGVGYIVLARKETDDKPTIHRTAEVAASASIGARTRIWNEAQIREGARIGSDCVLAKGVYVDIDVTVGNRVKLENRVSLFQGARLADGAFIGPHTCLLNDKLPRAITPEGSLKRRPDWQARGVIVGEGASIGGGCTILPGVEVGRFAMVGAGAVVTRNVPDHGLAVGNPARLVGYVCECGTRLNAGGDCGACGRHHEIDIGVESQ